MYIYIYLYTYTVHKSIFRYLHNFLAAHIQTYIYKYIYIKNISIHVYLKWHRSTAMYKGVSPFSFLDSIWAPLSIRNFTNLKSPIGIVVVTAIKAYLCMDVHIYIHSFNVVIYASMLNTYQYYLFHTFQYERTLKYAYINMCIHISIYLSPLLAAILSGFRCLLSLSSTSAPCLMRKVEMVRYPLLTASKRAVRPHSYTHRSNTYWMH
jgi:hypothetical protein